MTGWGRFVRSKWNKKGLGAMEGANLGRNSELVEMLRNKEQLVLAAAHKLINDSR